MPTIQVNDINLFYKVQGRGDPLVLICGFGSNHTHWKELIEPLSKKFQLLLFDNRGTGQTDVPDSDYSIAMMASDTAALMEALSIKSAYILGHSMGSAILQQLCLTHPHIVKKALLLNSFETLNPTISLQLDTTAKLLKAEVPIPLIIETLIPWLFGTNFLSKPQNIQVALNHFLNDPYPQTPTGFFGQLAALKTFDLRSQLSSITTPTLIATGDQDLYTLPSQSHYLHNHIPSSQLKVLKGAGHMIPYEQPQELFELMYTYFNR